MSAAAPSVGTHACALCGTRWTCDNFSCVDNRTLLCLGCDIERTAREIAGLERAVEERRRKYAATCPRAHVRLEEFLGSKRAKLAQLEAAAVELGWRAGI